MIYVLIVILVIVVIIAVSRSGKKTKIEIQKLKKESETKSSNEVAASSVSNEIIKLKKLLDDGVINQQEFETQKQKLLNK